MQKNALLLTSTLAAVLMGCSSGQPKHEYSQEHNPFTDTSVAYEAPVSGLPSRLDWLNIPNADVIKSEGQGMALRGNSPRGIEDLKTLQKVGVTEVIIFKNDKKGEVKAESAQLQKLGYKPEQIHHIDFDWKDNANFQSGCEKFLEANSIMAGAISRSEKSFIHCTTGEDRTGAAAAVFLLAGDPNLKIEDVFKNEMCAKGYEAGDTKKPRDIVNKIRVGMTITFLKMAYQIKAMQAQHKPLDKHMCETDPATSPDFQKSVYNQPTKFYCD